MFDIVKCNVFFKHEIIIMYFFLYPATSLILILGNLIQSVRVMNIRL